MSIKMLEERQSRAVIDEPGPTPLCVIVLVLYRMAAGQSPAYQSLQPLLSEQSEVATAFHLVLWDNSPSPNPPPQGFAGTYLADPSNPGLAEPYNEAVQIAEDKCAAWLLLLDQDTVVHAGYLREVCGVFQNAPLVVGAVLPRLCHAGRTVSPSVHSALAPPLGFAGATGLQPQVPQLQAFNSGAALRVEILRRVGGFDSRFPLEYLDHATFAALHRAGARLWVLQSELTHDLSTDTGRASTPAERQRQRSILSAERRFVHLYGTRAERLLLPVRRLRGAASVLLKKRDLPGALLLLRHLF